MKYQLARFFHTLLKTFWEVLRLFILVAPVSLPWIALVLILLDNPDVRLPYQIPAALPLCLLGLFLSYFIGHLFWPLMMIILFPISRLRDPKYIIRLGERFRKLNLTAPQIFVVKNSSLHFLNRWPVIGFFALPKPFGASIFMTQKVFDPLNFKDFDLTISKYAVQAKYHRWSSTMITFLTTGLIIFTCAYSIHQYIEPSLNMNFDGPFSKFGSIIALSILVSGFSTLFTRRAQDKESQYELTQLMAEESEIDLDFPAFMPKPRKSILLLRLYTYSTLLVLGLTVATLGLNDHIQKQVTSFKLPKFEMKLPTLSSGPKKTAFTEAIERKNHRQIMLLIGQGQDNLLEPTLDNAPALLVAAKYGDLKTVYLLLLVGHSIDQVDDQGRNIYFYALEAPDRVRVLKYLLQTKANRHHRDKKQMTPLDLAREKKYPDAESILMTETDIETKPVESIDQASQFPASTRVSTEDSERK